MKNDEIITNLLVLQYYFSEIQEYCGNEPKPSVIDEYLYAWNIQQVNFKIIKSLLIIENEKCMTFSTGNIIINYIKE